MFESVVTVNDEHNLLKPQYVLCKKQLVNILDKFEAIFCDEMWFDYLNTLNLTNQYSKNILVITENRSRSDYNSTFLANAVTRVKRNLQSGISTLVLVGKDTQFFLENSSILHVYKSTSHLLKSKKIHVPPSRFEMIDFSKYDCDDIQLTKMTYRKLYNVL